jgi:hypothetical protein
MFKRIIELLGRLTPRKQASNRWKRRTLVVGPVQPVDGDSVSSTKALISHLRGLGLEAYTLPTRVMYRQLEWILESADFHPHTLRESNGSVTTDDLQKSFDSLIAEWRPDEIVLVDGPPEQLGFDSRGVPVYTIDHHITGGVTRDDGGAYIQPAPSAGCLLIEKFGIVDPILAVSILTDTFWFRHNMPAQAARCLAKLAENGLTDTQLIDLQKKLMVRKDPRILTALNEADLRIAGDAAFAVLKTADVEIQQSPLRRAR